MPGLLAQMRKPTGPVGQRLLASMNHRHSLLTDWGLSHVQVRKTDAVLDIGCGGGRTVQKLAALATAGRVCGIDFSETSVETSRATNAAAIAETRVTIQLASVEKIPFPDLSFDVVTAVETHYYWPDLPANLREVLRVLKPGGTLVIIMEAYRRGWFPTPSALGMWLLRAHYLTVAQHQALLAEAGFRDVNTFEDRWKGWLCVTAERPTS
jgi:ubiquinone/menaquinone biosynthesis C-methylase UbiE